MESLITPSQYYALITSDCYYCGSPEFWTPLPIGNFFDVRNERNGKKAELYRKQLIKSGIWFCGTEDDYDVTTFEEYGYDNYWSVYDKSAKSLTGTILLPVPNEKTKGIDVWFPISMAKIKSMFNKETELILSKIATYTQWTKSN